MNFAALLNNVRDYLNLGKMVTLGIPGTLLAVGILLLIGFPMPSYIEQRRPALVAVEDLNGLLLDEPACAADAGQYAEMLLCTVRVRDSLARARAHLKLDSTIRTLAALTTRANALTSRREIVESNASSLFTHYSSKLSENSLLSSSLRSAAAEQLVLLDDIDSIAANVADSIAVFRQDSAQISARVAVIDTHWRAFEEDRLFASSLGKLTTGVMLLVLFGYVFGSILDPINRLVFLEMEASWFGVRRTNKKKGGQEDDGKSGGDAVRKDGSEGIAEASDEYEDRTQDAKVRPLYAVGRGWLTKEDHDYLVANYYRYAELAASMIIPMVVFGFGIAHAVPPIRGVGGAFALAALTAIAALLMIITWVYQVRNSEGLVRKSDGKKRSDGKEAEPGKANTQELSEGNAQESSEANKDESSEPDGNNTRVRQVWHAAVDFMWPIASLVAFGVFVYWAFVIDLPDLITWVPETPRWSHYAGAAAILCPAAYLLVLLSRKRLYTYRRVRSRWIKGAREKEEAASEKTNEDLLKKANALLNENRELLEQIAKCKHGMPASVLVKLEDLCNGLETSGKVARTNGTSSSERGKVSPEQSGDPND